MKTLKIIFLMGLSFFLFSFEPIENEEIQTENRIEVIDFHSTHRCETCLAIESNTKYTINTFYAKEKEAGILRFDLINIDDEKNERIVEAFEAYGTSLFLNVIIDGKETHIDLTEFAFMNANDKDAFTSQLSEKIKIELSKL